MHIFGGETDTSDFLGPLPQMPSLRPCMGAAAAASIPGGELRCRWWRKRRRPVAAAAAPLGSPTTLPYIAVGPSVVELRNVAVRRCSACGHMGIDVPDVRALDVLVRCLCGESTSVVPRLEYADGRWRILARTRSSYGR